MKNVKYFLIGVLILIGFSLAAQSEDPFRTISGTSGSLKVPETNAPAEETKTKTVVRERSWNEKDIEVLDPQHNKRIDKVKIENILSVNVISLIGDIDSQTVELTIIFTNHQTNRNITIHNLTAYDNLGDSNSAYGKTYETFTDIPIKATFTFRTKVLPSKVSKMNVIKIPFGAIKDVEFRNIDIDWR
ncbi:MAG: hypothetical protein LBP67_06915 [Bacteroidales bacterium]|jgi:hypothetical protein|nr:hypothetical protein [Bacteroidales bacterium]